MNFKVTIRTIIPEICIGASMTLRTVTSLELMQQRMRMVISYRLPQHFGKVEETFLPAIEYLWC